MNRSQVSPDGKTAYATVVFSKFGRALPDADLRALVKDGEAARSANLQVEFGGNAIAALNAPKGSPGEMIGIIAAGLIPSSLCCCHLASLSSLSERHQE